MDKYFCGYSVYIFNWSIQMIEQFWKPQKAKKLIKHNVTKHIYSDASIKLENKFVNNKLLIEYKIPLSNKKAKEHDYIAVTGIGIDDCKLTYNNWLKKNFDKQIYNEYRKRETSSASEPDASSIF